MKKLKDSRGETLVETMVSILIAVLAFSFLAMAAVTAAKLNARVRDTDLSFRYEATPAVQWGNYPHRPDCKRQ